MAIGTTGFYQTGIIRNEILTQFELERHRALQGQGQSLSGLGGLSQGLIDPRLLDQSLGLLGNDPFIPRKKGLRAELQEEIDEWLKDIN